MRETETDYTDYADYAEDLGVREDPVLAAKLRIFQENMDFLEQNRDRFGEQHPGEMVIVQNGTVVAHRKLEGTAEEEYVQMEALWQQVEDAGLDRGSAHYEFFGELADVVTR